MNQWIPWKERQLRLLDSLLCTFLFSGILALLPSACLELWFLSFQLCQSEKVLCLLTLGFSLPSQPLCLYCLWTEKWLGESSVECQVHLKVFLFFSRILAIQVPLWDFYFSWVFKQIKKKCSSTFSSFFIFFLSSITIILTWY